MPATKTRSPKRKSNLTGKFRVRSTAVGKGLFAAKQFRKGQILGEVLGEIIVNENYDSRYCIELSDTHVLEPEAPFRLMNHSCHPNCELFSWEPDETGDESHRIFVAALRTIRPGDELTIDYAWPATAAIPCLCKAEGCRGWIVDPGELKQVKRKRK
jgi:SET domain-containing protein